MTEFGRSQASGPMVRPPRAATMSTALSRNIDALVERRRKEAAAATREEKIAQAITGFTGSMRFVYLHVVIYGAWIAANLGVIPSVPKFDPSFVILAMEASVEAIFLSTFVLISQNRTSAAADKRADLDLQINLLAEHELTKVMDIVSRMAAHLDVPLVDAKEAEEIEEIKQDVAPEAVLDELDARQSDN